MKSTIVAVFCALFACTLATRVNVGLRGVAAGSGSQADVRPLSLATAVGADSKGAKGSEAGDRAFDSATLAVQQLVSSMLAGEGGVQLVNIIAGASKYVDYDKAAQVLAQKHPLQMKEMSSVFARINNTKGTHALTEESLAKARGFLNALVEAAQKELDAKIIECKEFEAMNRGSHAAVVADISRLGSQVADQMGLSSEATSGIADMNRQLDDVKRQRQNENDAYDHEHAIDFADMTVKQNDLDVFDFLIKSTKKICDNQALLDVGHHTPQLKVVGHHAPQLQVCGASSGDTSLRFGDAAMQAKFDQLLLKGSRDLLNNALGRFQSKAGLLQAGKHVQPAAPVAQQDKTPVAEGQSEELGDVKCGPIPDCGLLYDTLSLQWGGYKDEVDKLKKEMDQNDAAWKTLKEDFDSQISSLTSTLDKFMGMLSEATAAKNGDQQRTQGKEDEKRVLDDEHREEMQRCRDRITYIVQQDICGPTVIRNEIMKESTDCKTDKIDDCDVTPWTPAACSVECDDRCPSDTIVCGGTQTLTRTTVVTPNECGIKCPDLTVVRKCNQFKCPVSCVMSQWSGWSKCSKDCEGGVQERTRSVLIKALNGGQGCAAVSDGRPCNTGSCDRDCSLEAWSSWSPCSMACGGGNQDRVRKVTVPIRGGGSCPTSESSHRFQRQECNAHVCVGDELCVAKQDLVVVVDGSGSVHADGFKLVREFTEGLLERYRSRYWGDSSMQVGMVLFGNGAIEEDGTISKAVLVHELSDDIAAVRTAAEGIKAQKGFTNLAQAYALAQKLLQQKSRKDAQSAVLTISDGKPSFLFETREKNKAMKDGGITFFNVGISEFPGSDQWKLMQEMASQPAETNTVRVPGLDALQDGGGPFVQEALTKFCPYSISPSMAVQTEESQGYMLVRKGGYCGELGECTRDAVHDPALCKTFAEDHGSPGFALGQGLRAGSCCIAMCAVPSCDMYKNWMDNQENPECDKFEASKFYNWYAVAPVCDAK